MSESTTKPTSVLLVGANGRLGGKTAAELSAMPQVQLWLLARPGSLQNPQKSRTRRADRKRCVDRGGRPRPAGHSRRRHDRCRGGDLSGPGRPGGDRRRSGGAGDGFVDAFSDHRTSTATYLGSGAERFDATTVDDTPGTRCGQHSIRRCRAASSPWPPNSSPSDTWLTPSMPSPVTPTLAAPRERRRPAPGHRRHPPPRQRPGRPGHARVHAVHAQRADRTGRPAELPLPRHRTRAVCRRRGPHHGRATAARGRLTERVLPARGKSAKGFVTPHAEVHR